MRFYTTPHRYYCGIDLHARRMYICVLDADGQIRVHRNGPATPEHFLTTVAAYREDLVVAVECMINPRFCPSKILRRTPLIDFELPSYHAAVPPPVRRTPAVTGRSEQREPRSGALRCSPQGENRGGLRARSGAANLRRHHGGVYRTRPTQRRQLRGIPAPEGMRLLSEGKVDGYLGFPPDPQEMRAKKIGRVVVNSAVDRPWSRYFCCMVVGNKEFVRRYPVATKRALRAILKATDLCALEPERAARSLVDGGFTPRYDYALQTIKELPYDKWRLWDPEDTVRFYALRLHEAGMIKSSPQKIIAQGTDWRFLKELKKELKG